MRKVDYDRLKFRRGYLLTALQVECPFIHNIEKINADYTLYYHPDLAFTKIGDQAKTLYLLGDLYDYQDPNASNIDILRKLLKYSFNDLVINSFIYAGRFVLIYSGPEGVKLFHDAASLRKVFYTCKNDGTATCASNPHLLAEALGFERTKNPCWLEFYKSNEFVNLFNGNIGNYTLYDEERQLLPNHYYDIINQNVVRYWPYEVSEKIDDREIVKICARMIKGFMLAISHRYPLMIPVTSGYDSRIILAATKEITENIFYYINYSDDLKGKPDYWVPKKMLESQHRTFHLVNFDTPVDDEFKKIYYHNNPLPYDYFLPIINNYYLNFSDKVNMPGGFIPLIKSLYFSDTNEITGIELAHLYHVGRFSCAVDFYNEWLKSSKDVCDKLNMNLFDLLYWEDRTANWGTQVSQDKDIAQEEFLIFNSRQLMVTMLNYTRSKRGKPFYELHKEIIKELWPELGKVPFNPSFRSTIKKYVINLGLYKQFDTLKKLLLK